MNQAGKHSVSATWPFAFWDFHVVSPCAGHCFYVFPGKILFLDIHGKHLNDTFILCLQILG